MKPGSNNFLTVVTLFIGWSITIVLQFREEWVVQVRLSPRYYQLLSIFDVTVMTKYICLLTAFKNNLAFFILKILGKTASVIYS